MWIADHWNDYEVIDCSKGEKLERWGDYILVRPDPQVIWDTPKKEKGWHRMNAHYHRSKKGGGEWEFFDLPEQWTIRYERLGLKFHLKPFSFKHTGLFPEQAANWDWFSEKIRKAGRPHQGSEPVCLHRRRHAGCRFRRGRRDPRGRVQRDGSVGEGKRRCLRSGRRPHPLAGGRLCQIRRAGDPQGQPLRRHHYGSALLRPRPQGGNLEDRGRDPSAGQTVHTDFVRTTAFLPD